MGLWPGSLSRSRLRLFPDHYRYHPVLERLTNITNHPDFGGVSEVLVDFTMLDVKSYWRSLTIDEADVWTPTSPPHTRSCCLVVWEKLPK